MSNGDWRTTNDELGFSVDYEINIRWSDLAGLLVGSQLKAICRVAAEGDLWGRSPKSEAPSRKPPNFEP
jgi:hypothetical protein